MVELSVLVGRKINLKWGGNQPRVKLEWVQLYSICLHLCQIYSHKTQDFDGEDSVFTKRKKIRNKTKTKQHKQKQNKTKMTITKTGLSPSSSHVSFRFYRKIDITYDLTESFGSLFLMEHQIHYILYYIILYYIILYYIILYHIISYHIISYHIILYYIFYYIIIFHCIITISFLTIGCILILNASIKPLIDQSTLSLQGIW